MSCGIRHWTIYFIFCYVLFPGCFFVCVNFPNWCSSRRLIQLQHRSVVVDGSLLTGVVEQWWYINGVVFLYMLGQSPLCGEIRVLRSGAWELQMMWESGCLSDVVVSGFPLARFSTAESLLVDLIWVLVPMSKYYALGVPVVCFGVSYVDLGAWDNIPGRFGSIVLALVVSLVYRCPR